MSAAGARAAAQAVTAALGGTTIVVRMPAPPAAGADAEQLGLPEPAFQDIPIAPCVVRMQRDGSRVVLVSAPVLEGALGVERSADVERTMGSAAMVEVGAEALLLRDMQTLQVQGRAYLYRLRLGPCLAEVRG